MGLQGLRFAATELVRSLLSEHVKGRQPATQRWVDTSSHRATYTYGDADKGVDDDDDGDDEQKEGKVKKHAGDEDNTSEEQGRRRRRRWRTRSRRRRRKTNVHTSTTMITIITITITSDTITISITLMQLLRHHDGLVTNARVFFLTMTIPMQMMVAIIIVIMVATAITIIDAHGGDDGDDDCDADDDLVMMMMMMEMMLRRNLAAMETFCRYSQWRLRLYQLKGACTIGTEIDQVQLIRAFAPSSRGMRINSPGKLLTVYLAATSMPPNPQPRSNSRNPEPCMPSKAANLIPLCSGLGLRLKLEEPIHHGHAQVTRESALERSPAR